jgi:sRNA-binding regulator protein Hfq
MKLIVLAFLFINSISSYSQQKKAILYLKNGSNLQGFAKINSYDDEIKFKTDKNSKALVYKAADVEKIFLEEKNENIEYRYKSINEDKSRPYLLVLRIEGKLSLYEYYKSLPGIDNKSAHQKNSAIGNTKTYSIPYYFVTKNNEEQAVFLGSGGGIGGQKKFMKRTERFVSDCPELVKKIKQKEFQRKDIIKIIIYYNDNCSDKATNNSISKDQKKPKEKENTYKDGWY